jgi:hypothetical protein
MSEGNLHARDKDIKGIERAWQQAQYMLAGEQ